MDTATQLDMFSEATPQPRATAAPPPYAPFPDALLRRLKATLRMLQAAEVMPWREAEAASQAALFLGAVKRLPPERRSGLAEDFQAQFDRLTEGEAIPAPAE
jgi:hypothetical protein